MIDFIYYLLFFQQRHLRKARREAEIAAYEFLKRVTDGSERTYHSFQLDAAINLVGQNPVVKRGSSRHVKGSE